MTQLTALSVVAGLGLFHAVASLIQRRNVAAQCVPWFAVHNSVQFWSATGQRVTEAGRVQLPPGLVHTSCRSSSFRRSAWPPRPPAQSRTFTEPHRPLETSTLSTQTFGSALIVPTTSLRPGLPTLMVLRNGSSPNRSIPTSSAPACPRCGRAPRTPFRSISAPGLARCPSPPRSIRCRPPTGCRPGRPSSFSTAGPGRRSHGLGPAAAGLGLGALKVGRIAGVRRRKSDCE